MSIRVTTLGGLRVVRDDAELDALLAQRVRCALLVVLAVEGKATRDRLMGLLWPDKAPDKARHSLSQTLYELKKHLGSDWIEVKGELLEVTDVVETDVASFKEASESGRYSDALTFYGGDFLEGAVGVQGTEYGRWVEKTRSRLARLHRRVASERVAELADAGDLAAALDAARVWTEREPLDDGAQHAFIELLARTGRRSEALHQYEAYAARLEQELGVEPLDQTRELVEGLRGAEPVAGGSVPDREPGAPAAPPTSAPAHPSEPPPHPPEPSPTPGGAGTPPPAASAKPPEPPPTALASIMEFADELKRRRVTRVAIAYLVVAFAFLEGTDLLLGPFEVPEWLSGVLAAVVVFVFPVVLALAWVFDITPRGIEITDPPAQGRRLAVDRLARRSLVLVTVLLVVGVGGLWTWRQRTQRAVEDHRVMVFPLVVSGTNQLHASVGEDVATMIGHALDRTGPLRWIDGWTLLPPEERQNIRQLTDEEARALAVSRGCRYYVLGRVVARQNTALVYLDLWDALNGSVVARSEGEGGVGTAWQTGLRAVSGLLPSLVAEQQVPETYVDELENRDPVAAAAFLLGEQRLRRGDAAQAVERYNQVLQADSMFTLAAVRGTLAAAWNHDDDALLAFARSVRDEDLAPVERELLAGWTAFALGRGDEAVAAADRGAVLDPRDAQPWLLRGEALWHTAPRTPRPDEGIRNAFEEAVRLDPSGINATFHLLELALLEGRLEDADALKASFRAAVDLERLAEQVEVLDRCARRPLSVEQWTRSVLSQRRASVAAARLFAAGGRNLPCAEGAFWGMLLADSVVNNRDRRAALEGLVAVMRAQGRNDEATRLLDAASHSLDAARALAPGGPGASEVDGFTTVLADGAPPNALHRRAHALVMVHEAAGWESGDRAELAAARETELMGPDFEEALPGNFELYRLGVVRAASGDLDEVARIAAHMESVADSANPLSHALAMAVRGHEALARGDSVRALALFGGLRTEGSRSFLTWSYADPLAFERIQEARLLLARDDPGSVTAALDIASSLDGSALGYLPYLPASLEVRIQASERLSDPAGAQAYSQRLADLRASGTPEDP